MKLTLKRIAKRNTYTIGRLYVDGVYECDTIEDKDRGLTKEMSLPDIQNAKVYGQTAIPTGTYRVQMGVKSPKYSKRAAFAWCGGYLPRLQDVPGWSGVLIHSGNRAEDTLGCIIVGRNTQVGMVTESMATLKTLYKKLAAAKDGITITIQ